MKRTFLIQCGICVILVLIATIISHISNDKVENCVAYIDEKISTNITKEDFEGYGEAAKNIFASIPAKVVETFAGYKEEDESPYIEKSETKKTLDVYAVAGGQVIGAGYNSDIGYYARIKHEEGISYYKNMNSILVIKYERVKMGQIIGKSKADNQDFSYELIDKE